MPRTLWRDELGRFIASPAPRDWPSEISEPVRPPSVAADVVVPALQSIVSALASGCLTAVACWLFELPSWVIWAAMAATFSISWALRLAFSEQSLWRTASPVLPEPPAPQPAPPVRLELVEQSATGGVKRMRILDLPIDDQRLRLFAQAALEGQSLALARWCGAGRPFRRSEYVELCDRLEQAGWLVPARGNVGARLTAAGRAMLRKLTQ